MSGGPPSEEATKDLPPRSRRRASSPAAEVSRATRLGLLLFLTLAGLGVIVVAAMGTMPLLPLGIGIALVAAETIALGTMTRREREAGLAERLGHPSLGSLEALPRSDRVRRELDRFVRNRFLIVGLLLLAFYVVLGVVGPWLYPGTDPNSLTSDAAVLTSCQVPAAPSFHFVPFGFSLYPLGQTAHFGFGVAQGLILGTRWDLLIVGGILGISVAIGTLLGAFAAAKGGTIDGLVAAVNDGFLSFPTFLLLAVVLALTPLGGNYPWPVPADRIYAVYGVFAATMWPPFAQAVRAHARIVMRQPYVESARASGAGTGRVLWDHVVPNCSSPVLAQIPPTVGGIFLLMGTYQFVGLIALKQSCGRFTSNPGGPFLLLPTNTFPEWTYVLANGALGWAPPGTGLDEWWGYLIPAAWIVLFLFAVTLVCDGLVAHLSPYRHS